LKIKKSISNIKKKLQNDNLALQASYEKECAEGKEEGYNTISRKICKAHFESRYYLKKTILKRLW